MRRIHTRWRHNTARLFSLLPAPLPWPALSGSRPGQGESLLSFPLASPLLSSSFLFFFPLPAKVVHIGIPLHPDDFQIHAGQPV